MLVKLIISPKGDITVQTQDGSFLEGKEKIEAIANILRQKGIKVNSVDRVEQHVHGPGVTEHVHVQ